MKVSEALELRLVDYGPRDGKLGIDELVAATSLLVFKKGSIRDKAGKLKKKKVRAIHRESTRRGHASLTTTPVFFFEVGGSRLVDLYFSSFPFGSYLIFSSRRIEIGEEDLVLSDELPENAIKHVLPSLRLYHEMWGKSKDQARKVLPIGFRSHGFFKYSAEELLHMGGDHVPAEINLIAKKMRNHLKEKSPILHEAAAGRPSLFYHHPNIFHIKKWKEREGLEARSRIKELHQGDWFELSEEVIDLVNVRAVVSGSIAMWNEVKRHRTVLQKAESVYRAADRAFDELNSLGKGERPRWIHIPPLAGEDYLQAVATALEGFEKYAGKVGVEEAVYLVPHSVKLRFSITLNGYHLLHPFGFFGVRMCSTADYEIRAMVYELARQINEKLPGVGELIGPKCKTGVCPEREPCELLKKYLKA